MGEAPEGLAGSLAWSYALADIPQRWLDDKFERHALSLSLTKIVAARFNAYHSGEGTGALCVAIEAEWGIGKTFFVDRWTQDLEDEQHPVIRFDAWINDLSDDPLIGLLATLKAELKPFVETLPPAKRLQAQKTLNSLVKTGARAVWGAGTTALKGYLAQKVGQEAFDALAETVSDKPNEDAVHATSNAAIDKFVETAMESHQGRRAAIDDLKATFTQLAGYFKEEGQFRLPLYIWVDELDRCRPDYAVKLLEGIKHLFDAQGVCFIVTTNLRQLGETVKAVYGPGFNGYGYLKRFFHLEYTLPQPSSLEFAKQLFAASSIKPPGGGRWHTGLPTHYIGSPETTTDRCADVFAKVASAMSLSARTQMKVFRQAEAVLSYWPDEVQCVLVYVLALLAIQDKTGDLSQFAMHPARDKPFDGHVAPHKFIAVLAVHHRQELSILDVLNQIHVYASTPHDVLFSRYSNDERGRDFVVDLLHTMINRTWDEHEKSWLSIHRTVELVKTAALVK